MTIEILSIDSRLCLAEDDHPLLRHGLLSREEGEEKKEREKQQQEEKEEKHRESPLRASHPGTSTPRTRHATNHTHVDKPRVTHASHPTTRSFYLILRTKLYFFHSCVQRCHVSTTGFFATNFSTILRGGDIWASSAKRWKPCEILERAFDSNDFHLPSDSSTSSFFFFTRFFFLTKEPPLSTRFRNFCSREREREREQKGKRLEQRMFRTGKDVQQRSLAANFSPCDLCDSRGISSFRYFSLIPFSLHPAPLLERR